MPAGRWLDRTQPQTLMIATILLYVNAALELIGLIGLLSHSAGEGTNILLAIILVVGQAVAGWGIANQKKWAYWLGLALSVVILAYLVSSFAAVGIISLLFQIALVVLLVHPQSREYKRIWFR